MSNSYKDPFDNLTADPEFSVVDRARHDLIDYLIHKVFLQSEDGVELLEIWKESLTMSPVTQTGSDLLSIGIAEGKKEFIRNIINTITRVNINE